MKHYKKITTWLATIAAVLAVACAVSVVTICVNGAKRDIYTNQGDADSSSGAELKPTFDYGDGYIKKIIFIGDKTISQISSIYPEIKKDQVWSSADGSLPIDSNLKTIAVIHSDDEKGSSIPSAVEIYKPQYIIITVGLENGVAYCTEEKFKEYYIGLVNAIKDVSPNTNIILQSVFPISKKAEKSNPNIANDRIDTANGWIIELCEENSIRFLNTAQALKDDKGYLLSDYDSGDGITLNAEGYKAMVEYIRTHGYK